MIEKVKKYPIIPLFYHDDVVYAQQVVKACYEGGARFFEFTNRGEKAFENFKILRGYITENCPDMVFGIGTIYTAEDAERFIEIGADFIVQPVIVAEVAAVCNKHNKPWIPGALTLNEIYQAHLLGATIVKIFPGNAVGPDYIKGCLGPMPFVKMMITGGVEPTIESVSSWLNAGATCVGLGSQLFKGNFTDDFSPITDKIRVIMKYLDS